MIHRFPEYYKDFVCSADKCRDNCCRGKWDIEIDDDIPVFKVSKGGCTWLDDKGLCGLYGSFGEEYQSFICRQFPRFSEYFGDVKESGLGLACEEAARLLFTCDNDAGLVSEETEEEDYRESDFDCELAEIIFRMREILINISLIPDLNNESLVSVINECCEKFQDILDDYAEGDRSILSRLENYEDSFSWESINERIISPDTLLKEADRAFEFFCELPDIRRGFDQVIESIAGKLEDESLRGKVGKLTEEFDMYLYKNGRYDDYKRFMRYTLYRYFAKAVYDRDVALKGKMLVSFFSFLKLYDITRWLNNKKSFKLKDRISTVRIFSGEVEYSEDNMQQLFEDLLFAEE